jgi:hypothetical protein
VSMDYDKKPVTPIVTIICNSLKDIFLTGVWFFFFFLSSSSLLHCLETYKRSVPFILQ